MGYIRAFAAPDIPQVARLHRRVFNPAGRSDATISDDYHAYFTRVFLESSSRAPECPSLVCQDDRGVIAGFLGVVPRRMTMNGRRFQAALSSQFIVDPDTQGGLVAVRLARAFLDGPQDLSIADEANDIARKIWEGLGGRTSLLHSLHWTRPLRPARLALSFLQGRAGLAPLAVAARPLAAVVDALATRMSRSQLYQERPRASDASDLTDQALVNPPSLAPGGWLRVDYDEGELRDFLHGARQRRASGRVHAAVVRRQKTLGWYVYQLDHQRVANVLQIVAAPADVSEVLAHLFYQAAQHGAVAAAGRLDPAYLQALSDRYCVFHRRGPWVLVKSKHPELLRAFEAGDAFFSRLDGEWCLGF
jgi:hypothetical protein